MRKPENRDGRMCLTSYARRIGFDRNPLRRGTDRIEAAVRLAVLIMLIIGVPVAAIAVGRQADHAALRRAHAQQAAEHLVDATLLQQAPATGIPDPYTSIQATWALARWQPPGRPARTGEVPATVGAPQGSVVPTWINASGEVAAPPSAHRAIVGDVCIAVMLTCLAALLMLAAWHALARHVLDRLRLRAWEAGWRAAGPQWSGQRG